MTMTERDGEARRQSPVLLPGTRRAGLEKDMSTVNILSALSNSNQIITLGLEVAGQLVPLVKGAITEIKKISSGAKTETYQVVITADAAELDAITKLAADDLTALNAELARLGVPPVPPYDTSTSAALPAAKPSSKT
jgi:hypothetical protein